MTAVPDDRARLDPLSFDAVAADYDAARPRYPTECYDALGPLDGRRILDLAAGTGIVARELVRRGAEVIAVDPGAAMLRQLRRRASDARAVRARGEALPIADRSLDGVVCATAWHWLDIDRAVPEVRRIVRPSGFLALWWANGQSDPTVAWERVQSEVFQRWTGEDRFGPIDPGAANSPDDVAADIAASLADRGLDVAETTSFTWTREVTLDEHVRLLGTHSPVIGLKDRRTEFLAEVRAALAPCPTITERFAAAFVLARVPSAGACGTASST
jgi:SAM-dependent methyltransferase